MSNYAVTLNYNCHYGYVEYNEADKTAVVTLPKLRLLLKSIWQLR